MPITGAAIGAADALEQMVAQRMLAQKLEAEISQQQERQALDQRRQAEIERQNTADNEFRREAMDASAADRRQRSNTQGVRLMMADRVMQGIGEITPEDRRGLAALQIEAGDEPTMLNAPKPERDPIADYRKKAEIDAEFREPDAAPRPPGPFVVGGNLVDANGNVIFRGQDASSAGPSPYAQERNDRTVGAIDDIVGLVSPWSAGYGSLLSNLPQTPARQLRGKLDQLKANIAFNELTAMREASKTGGALGSVAVRELQLLENALGNLDQAQEPSQLLSELNKIKESAQRWRQAAGGAAQAAPMQPVTSRGGVAPGASAPAPKRLRFDRNGKPIP